MKSNNQLKLHKISTIEELRAVADLWDDLWQRSEVCCPRARAHLLSLWLEYKSYDNDFEAIIIEQPDNKYLAALPLISVPFKNYLRMGCLATSHETIGGDFLIDPKCDTKSVTDLLVDELAHSDYSFLSFDRVALNEPRWRKLLAALNKAGLLTDVKENYLIGMVDVNGDWLAYEKGLSRKYIRDHKTSAKRLAQEGETNFIFMSEFETSDLDSLLLCGFRVEDRSWKGKKGTSVLKTPGMYEYYSKEAALMSKQGILRLSFLIHKNKPIAFSYNYYSKKVHFAEKIGYDETFKKFGPGQQLTMFFLQHLHNLPRDKSKLFDFGGPLAPWTEKWSNSTYPVGRILSTTNKFSSRLLFYFNFTIKSKLQKILRNESN